LGLAYPGGPAIEKLATHGNPKAIAMPRMIQRKSQMAFSYSGLKTHMAHLIHAAGAVPAGTQLHDLCASFQEEALGQLVRKLSSALDLYPDVKSVLIAGGVAANQRLRLMMAEDIAVRALFPHPRSCSDNAEMIATYGYHLCRAAGGVGAAKFRDQSWDNYARYPFERFEVVREKV